MAQLRLNYDKFIHAGAEVIVLGPDRPAAFCAYWQKEGLPFIGLADIKSAVAKQYHQEVNLLKFGRMPAMFLIDRSGLIRYQQYGDSMSDIPSDEEVLHLLEEMQDPFQTAARPEVMDQPLAHQRS